MENKYIEEFHPVDIYVGQRIRAKRKAIGLNQSDLGKALDISFQQIQKYEKGENRVSASALYQISQALHCTVGHFFEGYEPPKEKTTFESLNLSYEYKGVWN